VLKWSSSVPSRSYPKSDTEIMHTYFWNRVYIDKPTCFVC